MQTESSCSDAVCSFKKNGGKYKQTNFSSLKFNMEHGVTAWFTLLPLIIHYIHARRKIFCDGRVLVAVGIWQRVSVLHAVCHSNKSPHPQRPKSVFVSFANKQNVWVLSGWAYGTCQELLVQLYSQTYIYCWHSLCLCLSETRDPQPRDFNLPVSASLNMWQSWNK